MDILANSQSNFDTLIKEYLQALVSSGLDQLGITLEKLDDALASSRPKHLKMVRKTPRTILTILGLLTFKRRYYYDEINNDYTYYLDSVLAIPKRDHLMNDVKVKLIEAASEMSYAKAGRYASCPLCPVSKSTVYRLIHSTDFYVEEQNHLIENDAKIHIQLDEKYVHILHKKHQQRLFTCTIFKGVLIKKKRRILLNRTLISHSNLQKLYKKLNQILLSRYKVTLDDTAFISGDLASYIQQSPQYIYVCRAVFVPDKYHIKYALRKTLEIPVTDQQINDPAFQTALIDTLSRLDNEDARKVRTLLKHHPIALSHYLDPHYEGCSQEGMNSHFYSSRFDKLPNTFLMPTIDRLSMVINARHNHAKLFLGFATETYDISNPDLGHEVMERLKYSINTSGMKKQTRKILDTLQNPFFR